MCHRLARSSQFVGDQLGHDAGGDIPLVSSIGLSSQFVGNQLGHDAGGDVSGKGGRVHQGILRRVVTSLPYAAIVVVLAGTIFQGLALLNVYSVPSTRIQASMWIYQHVKPGSVLTYEQWDDPLPYAVGNHSPYIYQQATYQDASGQTQTGLDLYGDDTTAKAQQLAKILPTVNVLTMATDRLDKSIPRLPFRYPLTIHYYQLLFSGQLGFHLAAEFSDRPNLLGITLNDSSADESYSVFDHPTVKLFVRDNPYPYTSQQLYQKLMAGVQLPAPGAQLSGAQKPLLLTQQQIAQDQQSPPFSVQFPAGSLSNTLPVLCWWLAIFVLGLLAFPLIFSAFRGMRDRGYIFSKTIGILLMAYLAWLLANLHVLPFSSLSTLLVRDWPLDHRYRALLLAAQDHACLCALALALASDRRGSVYTGLFALRRHSLAQSRPLESLYRRREADGTGLPQCHFAKSVHAAARSLVFRRLHQLLLLWLHHLWRADQADRHCADDGL